MAALMACLLFTACQQDEVGSENIPNGEKISFGVVEQSVNTTASRRVSKEKAIQDFVLRSKDATDSLLMSAIVTEGILLPSESNSASNVFTRATPITSSNNMTDFHVLAYWKKDNTLLSSLFMDEKVNSQGKTSDNTYYWPGDNYSLRFVAIAPEPSNTNGLELSASANPEELSFTYTVPSEVSNQPDIMIAASPNGEDGYLSGDYNAPVPLSFSHLCTAIKFEFGSGLSIYKEITSISFAGEFYNKGTYAFASNTTHNVGWNLQNKTTGGFSINIPITQKGTDDCFVFPEEYTLMMLPQVLTEGNASITITVEDEDGNSVSFTAPIVGEWKSGTTVTYKVDYDGAVYLGFDVNGKKIRWANKNIGAASPGDYGDYFFWGQTSKYTYYSANSANVSLPAEYDTATDLWGEKWRMPTKDELSALKECTLEWMDANSPENEYNNNGILVTGPNGKSIFLPAAGWTNHGSEYNNTGSYLCYWSSVSSGNESGYFLGNNNVQESNSVDDGKGLELFGITSSVGFSIRPVRAN